MKQLRPFSTNSQTELFQIFADLNFQPDALQIRYRVLGPINQLVLPMPVVNPQFRDELWTTTCLEIFLQTSEQTAYEEWNFSPSGNWAYYHFQDYRQPSDSALRLQPLEPLQWIQNEHQLLLQVDIPLYQILASTEGAMHYGLTAVLQLKSGEKQYWALHHAGDRPDFHLPASFTGKSRLD